MLLILIDYILYIYIISYSYKSMKPYTEKYALEMTEMYSHLKLIVKDSGVRIKLHENIKTMKMCFQYKCHLLKS